MVITTSESEEPTGLMGRIKNQFSFIQGNFLILMTSWLILDFASETPLTYFPLFIKELGGSVAAVGLIQSVQMFSTAIVQIPGGYLTDKYGRRWLIISMTILAAFARIFYVIAPSWEFLIFKRTSLASAKGNSSVVDLIGILAANGRNSRASALVTLATLLISFSSQRYLSYSRGGTGVSLRIAFITNRPPRCKFTKASRTHSPTGVKSIHLHLP